MVAGSSPAGPATLRSERKRRTKTEPDQNKTNTGVAMSHFHYVYILVSELDPSRHYTGLTDDLEARLKARNSGYSDHTSNFIPWRIETAIAFRSREKAAAFELYLKSHSGRAFATKHF